MTPPEHLPAGRACPGVPAGNVTSRSDLLETLDAELRDTAALLGHATRRGLDTRYQQFRQAWLREALRRFLAGDDAGARDLLDQVRAAPGAESRDGGLGAQDGTA